MNQFGAMLCGIAITVSAGGLGYFWASALKTMSPEKGFLLGIGIAVVVIVACGFLDMAWHIFR